MSVHVSIHVSVCTRVYTLVHAHVYTLVYALAYRPVCAYACRYTCSCTCRCIGPLAEKAASPPVKEDSFVDAPLSAPPAPPLDSDGQTTPAFPIESPASEGIDTDPDGTADSVPQHCTPVLDLSSVPPQTVILALVPQLSCPSTWYASTVRRPAGHKERQPPSIRDFVTQPPCGFVTFFTPACVAFVHD